MWRKTSEELEGSESAIPGLLTEFRPKVYRRTGKGGISHPGVGLTGELLENIQAQVCSGTEPWKSYFEAMLRSETADRQPRIRLEDPAGTEYASQKVNGWFIKDALTVYTQAILYYVTGDNVYRRNAVRILRLWSGLDPRHFAYFTDACIHVGIPMNRMCMGAEIIRHSSFQVTEGYEEGDLDWKEEEIERFVRCLVRPAVEIFMSSCDEFMNQHLYTVIGAMSGYLFMDDAEGYEKTVEWFTVNRNGKNPGFNGSVKRLFRQISTMDQVGGEEGGGRPLPEPVIQHMEMGRDQAHACGDLTNAVIIARLILGQKTKVDPVEGTVSQEENAVGVYEFLDDRILKAADFFFRYMLGYDAEWVPAPFSVRDGKIADNYMGISPNYRGRYNTINCWDLYVYYVCNRPDVDLKRQYPYFYEGFMKKVPSNYFAKDRLQINWDNGDGGGDFWLFVPAQMAGDERLLARPQRQWRIELRDRGVMVENKVSMCAKEETSFVRFVKSPKRSRLAVTAGSTCQDTVAFRIRTDGIAKLSLSEGVKGSVYLPNTGGEWRYVAFTRKDWEAFGDLYYLTIEDMEGTYVDVDVIEVMADRAQEGGEHIAVVRFADGRHNASYVTYLGAPLRISFAAETFSYGDEVGEAVSYEGVGLPEGAVMDGASGVLLWSPERLGKHSFYVAAGAAETSAVKKVEIYVEKNRTEAVRSILGQCVKGEVFTSKSRMHLQKAVDQLQKIAADASDEAFGEQLQKLTEAAEGLKLVSPKLEGDALTDEVSLDYPQMVRESTMGKEIYYLTDGQGTFCGYYNAVSGAHIMDFGPELSVSVSKFGFQARYGFSDRLAGVQVFGSNDRENWVRLTAGEAAYTQSYQEVEVREGEKDKRYRWLKICKTTEYPDALRGEKMNLLEFGELRIFGNGHENESGYGSNFG